MFQFEMDEVIFYIHNDRIHSAKVLARVLIENKYDRNFQYVDNDVLIPFGPARESYATCHGIVNTAFRSRQELIDSL